MGFVVKSASRSSAKEVGKCKYFQALSLFFLENFSLHETDRRGESFLRTSFDVYQNVCEKLGGKLIKFVRKKRRKKLILFFCELFMDALNAVA